MAHSIHEIALLRVRILGPNQLLLTSLWENALEENFRYPIASNKHRSISGSFLLTVYNFGADFSLQLCYVLLFGEPASSVKVDDCHLLSTELVDSHLFAKIHIRCPDNEVVHRK